MLGNTFIIVLGKGRRGDVIKVTLTLDLTLREQTEPSEEVGAFFTGQEGRGRGILFVTEPTEEVAAGILTVERECRFFRVFIVLCFFYFLLSPSSISI